MSDTQFIYNACFTAFYNANRPKRKRPLKLFKKLAIRKADSEVVEQNISIAKEAEKHDGNWVQKILQGRRIARKER